ncbi:FecR domain-containing protein [Pseudomonadota bacterium]
MVYFQGFKSRVLGAFALLLGLVGGPQYAAAEDWVYTVRPGDSLWQISNDYLISPEYWPKVRKLNNIEKTRQLPPGTRLTIPTEWLKQQPVSADVVRFRGNVELIRQGKVSALTSNHSLMLGDGIRTGKNSSISIKFSDGSQALVLPESEIYLEVLEAQKDKGLANTVIKIINGRIENKVTRQNKGSRYQITTPAAVAAVRGTEFRVAAENNGEIMRSEVLEGVVGVAGSGVTQNVTAGYATIAKVGSPPSAPRQLPAAPDLSGLGNQTAEHDVTFQWAALDKVSNYRAQLALDETYAQIVNELLLDAPQVTWEGLVPSIYYMRVRGVDELGLEGFNAQHVFTVNEPLRAPNATSPGDGISLDSDRLFVAWSSVADASFYQLQMAANDSFDENLIEYTSLVNNNFRPVDALPAGQYYWRVQSVSRNGDKSSYSSPRRFVIKASGE